MLYAEKLRPQSTMIKEIHYSHALEKLTVTFNDDNVYAYDGVPSSVFAQLQAASSVGQTFNALVRHQYNYHKVSRNEHTQSNGTQEQVQEESSA